MSEENQKVLFERQKRVGIITLNNGDFNVFDPDQIIQFRDLMKELEDNDKVRAILIKGSGPRAFSSGFDLKNLDKEIIMTAGLEMIHRLYNLPKATIALVHGFAIGIGFLVALACDFRYATEDASYSLPEINYDVMFPTHGGCSILPKLVRKPSDAKYILYTGDRFPTAKAAEMGLIDAVFKTKEEMFEAGMEFATKLGTKNPVILACTKAALKKTTYGNVRDGMRTEFEAIPFIDRPPDMKKDTQREAMQKFIEKYTDKF